MRMPAVSQPPQLRLLRGVRWSLPIALAIMTGCAGQIGGKPMDGDPGSAGSSGTSSTGPGTGGSNTTSGGTGGSGTGGSGTTDPTDPFAVPATCTGQIVPGRSPIRRITRFEYSNTVRDVLYDTTKPGSLLPSEVLASTYDLFANNADSQAVSSSLVESYSDTAAAVATRATAPAVLSKLSSCAGATTTANDTCARTLIEGVAKRAYRRAVTSAEVDDLFALYKTYSTGGFAGGIATAIEAILQAPDFLYRIEWGAQVPSHTDVLRPTGEEMATRLSYALWGTAPDDALLTAAKAGELDTPDGVKAHATTMVEDPRARDVVRYFFDKLLPIETLTDLARDATLYPTFSPLIGSYMHEETQQFLANEIFNNKGTWKSILTAPYSYVNEPLAKYYGISGVTGMTYQKVNLPDLTKRKGLLLQGGVMTGTITTNQSNPVLRGSFVVNKLLCRHISLPTDPTILAKVKIPEVDGTTARERFSSHSKDPVCRTCHQNLDPVGFGLENFDAVGLWRDQDTGHTIDASGTIPGIEGAFKNASEMVNRIADSTEAYGCFASHWLDFAYGRLLDGDDKDACVTARTRAAFRDSGYNVKQLLVQLTQTDGFLYMPAVKE